ncbi:uncharacterized protein LOC143281459 [Babylonia areolata]|uniref:uncharacterized protein LOC143281459 n=1 Tax=Babylonia areolata TaxID=304850 RepID=UPI003FD16166
MYRRRYRPWQYQHQLTERGNKIHPLLDFHCLRRTLIARGIQAVLRQVSEARKTSPNDAALQTLAEALQLSQGALHAEPKQLPTQLLSRIPCPSGHVGSLLQQCRHEASLHLVPRSRRPVLVPIGGPLLSCVHVTQGRFDVTTGLAITSDGRRVITTTGEELVVVDVTEGVTQRIKAQRLYDVSLLLACDDSIVILNNRQSLHAFSLQTGEALWMIDDNVSYSTMTCVAGPRQRHLVVFHEDHVMLYDVTSGHHTGTIRLPASAEYRFCLQKTPPVANDRYVVTTDKTCRHVVVLDVQEQRVLTARTMQPLPPSPPSPPHHHPARDAGVQGQGQGQGQVPHPVVKKQDNGKNKNDDIHVDNSDGEHNEGDEMDGDRSAEADVRAENEGKDDDDEEEDTDDEDDDEKEDSEDEVDEEDEEDDSGEEEEEQVIETFTVDGLCLTPAGQVICVQRETGHLYFLAVTTLDTVMVYQGQEGRSEVRTYHVTPEGRHLYHYCHQRDRVTVWDLHTARYWTSLHQAEITEVATVDGRTLVTVSRGSQVRVWDTSRQAVTGSLAAQSGTKQAKITVDTGDATVVSGDVSYCGRQRKRVSRAKREKDTGVCILMCVTLTSARYVLLVVADSGQYYLHVYDLATDTAVRKARIGQMVESRKHLKICHVGGSRVVFTVERRLKVVDIDTMKVALTFQGHFYHRLHSPPVYLKRTSELMTVTKGGHHVKAYSLETGLVRRIIRQDRQGDGPLCVCRRLLVNEAQTLAAFKGFLSRPLKIVVFDLSKDRTLCVINSAVLGPHYTLSADQLLVGLTDEGLIPIHGFHHQTPAAAATAPGKEAEVTSEHVTEVEGQGKECVVVLSVHQQRAVRHLEGKDGKPQPSFLSCLEFWLLDQRRLLVHRDEDFRVFNLHTGEVEKTERTEDDGLMGTEWYHANTCPLVVSKDPTADVSVFRVWRRCDVTPLAAFLPDQHFSQLTGRVILLPEHGEDFLVLPHTGDTPVLFHLQGADTHTLLGNQISLAALPALFRGEELDLTLDGLNVNVGNDDANDPDDDDDDDEK